MAGVRSLRAPVPGRQRPPEPPTGGWHPRRPVEASAAGQGAQPYRLTLDFRRQRAATEDGAIELGGLPLGGDVELPPEEGLAGPILAERPGAPTMAQVQAHDQPVNVLPERIDVEEAERHVHGV